MKIKRNNIVYPQKKTIFIPIVNPSLDYYISTKGKKSKPSPPELRIQKVLKLRKIKFVCECSFKKFGYAISPYRFDFYLPEYNCIIEYDGKHHSQRAVRKNDSLKNQFCKKNKIKIYRYNVKHYSELELYINRLCTMLKKINR